MPSVYIETSIPSYYHETRKGSIVTAWHETTRRWWDSYRHMYDLCISQFVVAELARAPTSKAARLRRLIEGIPLLDEPPGLQDVVQYYFEHRFMPIEAGGDAFHLAMASIHNVDFLLTWNCRHLANVNKMPHLRVLNGRLGLPVPTVTTPLTLMPEVST